MGHGVRVRLVEKRSSLAYVSAMFDCYRRGVIAMPSDAGTDDRYPGIEVTDRIDCAPGGGWFCEAMSPRHDDSPAQISLTSGTTGRPKPLLLSHRALGDVVDRLVDVMALDSSVREYVGVPVTYSFGLGRVRAVAAAGGRCFLPERGFRIDELARMLGCGEINALSAVPTQLRLALAQPERLRPVAAALQWLEIGSQSMSMAEKEAVRDLFPNARIVQHYGLTEASRSTFLLLSDEQGDGLASVGRPNGAVEIDVGDDGLIAVRGPHLADGIVTAAGIEPIADGDGWLVTRDHGRLDDQGRLFFEGRADHLLNIGGVKVRAELFEERLLARLGVDAPIAVARGTDALRGEIAVVAYAGSDPGPVADAAAAVAGEWGIGDSFALMPIAAIPRTATDKVRRAELTRAFDEGCAERAQAASVPARPGKDPAAGIRESFVALFGEAARNDKASFHSLGGDSLRYVQALIELERYLPELPEDWDTLSIGALVSLAEARVADPGAEPRRFLPPGLTSVRGLSCLLIVAYHVIGWPEGGALKLPQGSPWHHVSDGLGLLRLPVFAALAGFLYGAMGAARNGWGEFMGHKARQMLPPLIFVTFATVTLRYLAFGRVDSLWWAYVGGLDHLWFLDALLLIFALIAGADALAPPRARTPVLAALMMGAVIVAPLIPPDMPHVRAIYLVPFFVWGLFLYRLPALLRSNMLLGLAMGIAVAALAAAQLSTTFNGLLGQLGMVRWVCGACIVISLIRMFPRVVWLEWIAHYSFAIYLWHMAVISMVRHGLWNIGLRDTWPLFLLVLAAGVAIPIALHRMMSYFPRLGPWVVGHPVLRSPLADSEHSGSRSGRLERPSLPLARQADHGSSPG